MVDYNRQVKEAIAIIDAFASKGKFNEEEISFHVTRETGFGERFTKHYLKKALDQGFFSKDKFGIITTKVSTE